MPATRFGLLARSLAREGPDAAIGRVRTTATPLKIIRRLLEPESRQFEVRAANRKLEEMEMEINKLKL